MNTKINNSCDFSFHNMDESRQSTALPSCTELPIDFAKQKEEISFQSEPMNQEENDQQSQSYTFLNLISDYNNSHSKGAQKAFRFRQRQKKLQTTLQEENQQMFQKIVTFQSELQYQSEIQQIKTEMQQFQIQFSNFDRKNPRGTYQKLSKEVRQSSEFKKEKSLKQQLNSKKQRGKTKNKMIALKQLNLKLLNLQQQINNNSEILDIDAIVNSNKA